MDGDAADDLVEVGVDHVVGDAAEGGLEVDGDFVEGFGDAGFHDDLDVIDAGEGRADGFFGGFGVCCFLGGGIVMGILVDVVGVGVGVDVGGGRGGLGFGSDSRRVKVGTQREEVIEQEKSHQCRNPGDAPAVDARSDHGDLAGGVPDPGLVLDGRWRR